MRPTLRVVLASMTVMFCCIVAASAQNPVVVELFTSEGCSSCPPADAVLLQLSQNAGPDPGPLILLGEHVDYWNYIGWTDRFSSAQFSQRQSDYAHAFKLNSVYTPQMVIDGSEQFVSTDLAGVEQKIEAARSAAKPANITLQWNGDKLHVSVHQPGAEHVKLLLAVTEDGLSTAVGAGENGGRTLHHAAVVRQLREIGKDDKENFETSAKVSIAPDWNQAELKVAVLAQDPQSKKILGAAAVPYAHPQQ